MSCQVVFPKGRSMAPLIREGRNYVAISAVERPIRLGDVVLFEAEGRLLLHRIVAVKPDRLTARGDNCLRSETLQAADVLGLLAEVHYVDNPAKVVSVNSPFYRLYSAYILHLWPLRRLWLSMRESLYKMKNS